MPSLRESLRPCLDHKGQKCPWGESANGKVQDTVPKANPKGKRGSQAQVNGQPKPPTYSGN